MNRSTPVSQVAEYPRWSETLRDGKHVLIRPITPLDRAVERRFIEELSNEARRFRFLGQIAQPDDRMLERLTSIDPVSEAAFVAVTREDSQERIVGVSRYCRDAEGLRCECAVTVDEDWQNQGLGSSLMRHLIEVARTHGMRSMYSIDSAENIAMTDLAHFLGFRTTPDPDDSTQVIHELAL